MAKQNKTTENTASVADFIDTIDNEAKRDDSRELVQIITGQTGLEARMWGPAIVGFGSYHYKYESGREGDAPLVGFSPRVNAISLYLAADFPGREELLPKLGKHKASVACIYIKKLADVDVEVLKEMVSRSVKYISEMYPG